MSGLLVKSELYIPILLAVSLRAPTAWAQDSDEKPSEPAATESTALPGNAVSPGDAASEAEPLPEVTEEEAAAQPAGYIPGYRPNRGLGMSPHVPRIPALPGNTTIPFGAPDDTDGWSFDIDGWVSAALRFTSGARDNATTAQQVDTLHAPPRTPDFYGAFGGTNAPPGSWISLQFKYGNEIVTSNVTVTGWKPDRASAWSEPVGQNWVDQAYLDVNVPPIGDWTLGFTVGAFRNPYGSLGQYGAGQYNTEIIGVPNGLGETLRAEYLLSDDFTLYLEHGVMGRLGKAPIAGGPVPVSHAIEPSVPSSWVMHAHVGLGFGTDVPFLLGVHYLTNWSQDERDQVDSAKTQFIDESERPDGGLSVYGVDFRMLDNYLGNFAIAGAYADALNAQLLTGMSFFGAVTGEEMTQRYFGPQSGGTAQMFVLGFEYNFSWSKFLYYPEPFWGDGPDLITSVFSNMGFIQSEDPDYDGRNLIKLGTEVSYRFFNWVGVSGRYDYVIPNSNDPDESFHVLAPKLVFKTDWNSHEQVTLSYTRWLYGAHTTAEFPYQLGREQLDDQMFALNFGMWW